MTKDRIACASIADFSMAVCLRVNPSLSGKPVAMSETSSDSSLIYTVNNEAANAGVMCDMTIAQGRSYCPELIVKQKDIRRENAALDKLRRLLFTASPLIEETEPGCFFLDASGLNWLYKSEEELAGKIMSLIAPLKLPLQVGIANNKFVSSIAASTSSIGSFTVVPAKTERRFLNHLNIDYLPLSEDTRDKLLALGLKTIGQVAAFPSNEMTTRFGEEGTSISRLSRGDDIDHFLPKFARIKMFSRIPLFEPLQSAHEVIAHVEKALAPLLKKLSRTDRGCRVVYVKLHLEDKSQKTIHLALKQPVAAPEQYIRKLAHHLNSLRLTAGVMDITIVIPETLPLVSSQLELIRDAGSLKGQLLDDSRIPDELRRVTLLSPSVSDAIIPDNNFNFHPLGRGKGQATNINGTGACYALNPVAGLRLLHPAQKATVVASGRKIQQLKLKQHVKPIVKQKGPWELSGGWWDSSFDRMYYEVQTKDHQLYLLYFDRKTPGWYLQGVFD